MLIDTHAHLDFPEFAADLPEVLARAEEAGVSRIITIGTSLDGSRRAVKLAETFPNVFAAIGVHPNSAGEATETFTSELRELAKSPRVVAIGETGLDYHRLSTPGSQSSALDMQALGNETAADVAASIRDGAIKSAQAAAFAQQLDLAVELGLNVIIHERDAWDDTLALLRDYSGKLRGVFHCFGKSIQQARDVLELGHLVSFTGLVTFKNAASVQEAATGVPSDGFMVETDCPFLAPVPHRGKRSEPAHTRLVANRIADLRGETAEAVAAQTSAAAERFFRFPRD